MKKNLVPLLGIAFVAAIVATGIFYGLFSSRMQSTPEATGPKVVVAARALERGAELKPEDVKLVTWGGTDAPKGVLTLAEQANGMVLLHPVQENEPIALSRVAGRNSGAGAAMGVTPGMRAVSIHVTDSSGVVNLLRSGHRVDAQLVAPQERGPVELRTIVQNIEVLGLNVPADGRTVPVVTLLVTPEEADMLGLGDSAARVRLVLRHPLDKERRDLPRLTVPSLLQPPPPGRAPATGSK